MKTLQHLLTLAALTLLTACNGTNNAGTSANNAAGSAAYTHIVNGEVLTLEDNGTAGYALYGSTTLTRDTDGLNNALAMQATLALVINDLRNTTK